ncbi:hypothetical protein E4U22_007662 [Claviceps purpurea]|nr:hypothetical protein E4U50_004304 [Claviceps purpurea]KAG6315685.1 hypothetical protein E4U22_007662 [Claviceps purpurea]
MSRAIKAALGRMNGYVLSPVCPGRRDKILRGNGVFGMRAAPTPCRDNDRMIGIRPEYGEILFKDGVAARRYYLRANKNAHDLTLRALAAKNAHAPWSYADVPLAGELAKGSGPSQRCPEGVPREFFRYLVKNVTKG